MQNEQIGKLIGRVSNLEDDIYHAETRDDRLTRIENKINDCRKELKQHASGGASEFKWIKEKIHEIDQKEEEMNKRFSIQESLVKEVKLFANSFDEKLKRNSDHCLNQLSSFQKSTIDNLHAITRKIDQL